MKAKNLLMSLLVAVMFPVALVLSACGPANIGTVQGKNLVLDRVTLTWEDDADKDAAYEFSGVADEAALIAKTLEQGYYGIVGLDFQAEADEVFAVNITFASEEPDSEEPDEATYAQEGNTVTIPWEGDSPLTFVVQGAYLTASMDVPANDGGTVVATAVYYFKVA